MDIPRPIAEYRPIGPFFSPSSMTKSEYVHDIEVKKTNSGKIYEVDGINNPELSMQRGSAYLFNINAKKHPFHIATEAEGGNFNSIYTQGVTVPDDDTYQDRDYAVQKGQLVIIVPQDAPDVLYYQCGLHKGMGNKIKIKD
jgi:hypothetical protein